MFRLTREKPTFVRILDVPIRLVIEPTFIIAPIDGDKVLIIHGNFDCITDAEATRKVQEHLTKIAS